MPVTTLTPSEVTKRAEEIDFAKVGTQGLDEVELAVGALPEHEVTEALLA